MQISSQQSSNGNKFFPTLFLQIDKFRIYTSNKLEVFNTLQHIVKWLGVLISFFCQLLLTTPNFFQFWLACDFTVLEGATNDITTQFFGEINVFIVFIRGNCILRQYTKILPEKLMYRKFLKQELSTGNRTYSTKWQKVGTKMQSESLEQVSHKQAYNLFSRLMLSKAKLPWLRLNAGFFI